jgi:vancomycin resistance protein YoaR
MSDQTSVPAAEPEKNPKEEPIHQQEATPVEEPVDTTEPITEEETADTEEPATEEGTADTEEPVTEEETADTEEPVTEEETADTEESATEEETADAEEPATEEGTADTEESATEEEAADTEEPVTEEETVETEQPATEEETADAAAIITEESVTEEGLDNMEPLTETQGIQLEKKKKKLWVIGIVSAAVLVVIAVVSVVLVFLSQKIEKELDIDAFYQGISIEGIDLSGKTKEEAQILLEEKEKELRDPIALTITYEEKQYQYTQDDFQYTFNTDEVIEEAYQYGKEGNIWIRYFKVNSLENDPKNFTIDHELVEVEQTAEQIVKEVAADNDRDPQDATIGEFSTKGSTVEEMFQCVEGVVGIEVDQDQLLKDCMEILDSDDRTGTVTVEAEEIPYEVSAADLMEHIKPLGSYSTTSTNTANGNHNMAVALGKINGTILQPGETFSFNGVVGRRTVANGFREAGVIQNGELVDGLGGGVCQASTTVYGAAIRSGMTVVERGNHRWPSSYVPIGQDAMVSWGSQDMKFRNDSDYPVYIKAYMSGTKLYVSMYGDLPEEWDKIEITSWKTETIAPGATQYVDDPTLEKGKTEVKIQSRSGSKASAQRIYYKNGAVVKKESLPSSYYRPVTGVIRVGTAETPVTTPVEPTTPPAEE